MDVTARSESEALSFRCNICGASCCRQFTELKREQPSCGNCGSTGRWRSIVSVLSTETFGRSLALPDFPIRRDLVGLGMTDWDGYALFLAKKFSYQNTFYHQEPKLDIAAVNIPTSLLGNNFIISSEVFEHVAPPVSKAFENAHKMLKRGGLFILTVPYGLQPTTTEHFPELNEFTLIRDQGHYILKNITSSGEVQVFRNLIFHGGPGSTLEMRVFSEGDLAKYLESAGFGDVKIHRQADLEHGVWWPQPWGFPLSGRKS